MAVTYLNCTWQEGLASVITPADAVICDPIYESDDFAFVQAAADLLRPGGCLWVFGDQKLIADTKLACDAARLEFLSWCIWPNDWGGRPRDRFPSKHDDILLYRKPGADHHWDPAPVQIPKITAKSSAFNPSGRATKTPPSVWSDIAGFSTQARERVKQDGRCVRWQKPLAVVNRMLLPVTRRGDLVVDFFGGVATVPVACLRSGRRCVSFESDPIVHQAGTQRLKDERTTIQQVRS